jgi:predicted HAD superfamily Cof-like phosphohydrolase
MSIRRVQLMVEAFHSLMGLPVGVYRDPAINRGPLRVVLIEEEAAEFRKAVETCDLPAAADALADLLYVTLGAAVEFGIELEPVFLEVHEANMRKVNGPIREDGKKLKPTGWQAPDVRAVIELQRKRWAP